MVGQGQPQIPNAAGELAYLRPTHRLHAHPQRISFQQNQLPAFGGCLPFHQLQIQLNLYSRR